MVASINPSRTVRNVSTSNFGTSSQQQITHWASRYGHQHTLPRWQQLAGLQVCQHLRAKRMQIGGQARLLNSMGWQAGIFAVLQSFDVFGR